MADTKAKIKGGSFLLQSPAPADIFTPEDFSEEHKLIGQTTHDYAEKVRGLIPQIEQDKPKHSRPLMKEAGDLGLLVNLMNLAPVKPLDGGRAAAHTGWLSLVPTVAVLIFATLTNVFVQNNLSSSVQNVAKGIIIVVAVLLQQRFAKPTGRAS